MRLLKKDPVLFFTLVIDEIWDELRTQGEFTLRSWGAIAGKDLVCYGTVSDYVFFHNKKNRCIKIPTQNCTASTNSVSSGNKLHQAPGVPNGLMINWA